MKNKIIIKIIYIKCNKNRKNILLLIYKEIAYLNFINACQNRFSRWIDNYIEYFTILYQSLSLLNYINKIIYIVVYFK